MWDKNQTWLIIITIIIILHTRKAIVTHAMISDTIFKSRLLKTICVPVIPNRIGSKTIQKISNAVATGFYINSHKDNIALHFITLFSDDLYQSITDK